jgi:anthranilate/para-aminobenzoate synthase component I
MHGLPHLIPVPQEYGTAVIFARLGTRPQSFCLDAGGRYTFLGADPVATFQSQEGFVTTQLAGQTPHTVIDDPIAALRRFATRMEHMPIDPYLPFYGGLVGFVSFEWGAQAQNIAGESRSSITDDAWFGLYDTVVLIDHLEKTAHIASVGFDEQCVPRLDIAKSRADALLSHICNDASDAPMEGVSSTAIHSKDDLIPVAPIRRYREIAQQLQQCLWQGVAQKINFAQRYVTLLPEEPWAVHAQLRETNPTPYGMFLNTGGYQLSSVSPTCFLALDRSELLAKPVIAHRACVDGGTPSDLHDAMVRSTEITGLLHRLKEEFLPLGDGTVDVDLPHLEADRQAAHLSCNLRLKMRSPLTILDALATLVPGLSMTGFPRNGALQLLSQHEPFPRHAYTGAMGYWAPQHKAQFNLSVRLLTIHEGLGYIHAASWLDPRSDIEASLSQTNDQVTQFFSRLHNTPITTINEQSLY